MYKISWKTLWFWVTIGLSVITSFLSPRYEVNDAGEYVQTYGVSGFLSVILLICSIALAVISIMQLWKLAKSFGRGVGFFLGLLFLNSIFMLILAFGSSRYVGPEGIPANGQVAAPDEPDRLQGA